MVFRHYVYIIYIFKLQQLSSFCKRLTISILKLLWFWWICSTLTSTFAVLVIIQTTYPFRKLWFFCVWLCHGTLHIYIRSYIYIYDFVCNFCSNKIPDQVDGARGSVWEEVFDKVRRLVIRCASVRDYDVRTSALSRFVDQYLSGTLWKLPIFPCHRVVFSVKLFPSALHSISDGCKKYWIELDRLSQFCIAFTVLCYLLLVQSIWYFIRCNRQIIARIYLIMQLYYAFMYVSAHLWCRHWCNDA